MFYVLCFMNINHSNQICHTSVSGLKFNVSDEYSTVTHTSMERSASFKELLSSSFAPSSFKELLSSSFTPSSFKELLSSIFAPSLRSNVYINSLHEKSNLN